MLVRDGSGLNNLTRPCRAKRGGSWERVMADKRKLTGLGIALGAALGTVVGVLAGHVAIWLAIGIAIGMAIGATVRRKETECPECMAMHRAHVHKTNQAES